LNDVWWWYVEFGNGGGVIIGFKGGRRFLVNLGLRTFCRLSPHSALLGIRWRVKWRGGVAMRDGEGCKGHEGADK
jgi:hypothetical protein